MVTGSAAEEGVGDDAAGPVFVLARSLFDLLGRHLACAQNSEWVIIIIIK